MSLTSVQAISDQLASQLRLLDPSIAILTPSPERTLLDTVAQGLYDAQVDLTALQGALDVDAKYGAGLDKLLALFGFNRKTATFATGYLTFSRTTASTSDIRIPASTICLAPTGATTDLGADSVAVQVLSIYEAILPAGSLSVTVPARALTSGLIGNIPAGAVASISGTTAYGITGVTNDVAFTEGLDSETDNEYKVRFKNTVFRNMAGTEDQFLALAVALSGVSKANVVGPQSTYREYVQVPFQDDASGNGTAGQYTTALSGIRFAKAIYDAQFPVLVTSGTTGPTSVFYRQDVDFKFNLDDPSRNRGDAYNLAVAGTDDPPGSTLAKNRPNYTFLNVYTGPDPSVTAVTPGEILLTEFKYLSGASRNNLILNITNAVDVYVDGENPTQASSVMIRPTSGTAFDNTPNSKFYFENYRRIGIPNQRPRIGNILTTLYWQPVTDVPDYIMVGTDTYFKGINYWAVEDVSSIGGTVRSRSGLEWSATQRAKAPGDPDSSSSWTGKIITNATGDPAGTQPVQVLGYSYDRNTADLQASLNGSKQVTTDVLAHRAKTRWLKLDVTVMYDAGISIPDTNLAIRSAVDSFLRAQYFGSAIQLSDLLQVIHGVAGVDNVRWSSDTPGSTDLTRVYETDRDGDLLAGALVERIQSGGSGNHDTQKLYVFGNPQGGSLGLTFNGTSTSLNPSVSNFASALASFIYTASAATATVILSYTSPNPQEPFAIYDITFSDTNPHPLLVVNPERSSLQGGSYVFDQDILLGDKEQVRLSEFALTTDTAPGMIIRPRAQGSFLRIQ